MLCGLKEVKIYKLCRKQDPEQEQQEEKSAFSKGYLRAKREFLSSVGAKNKFEKV